MTFPTDSLRLRVAAPFWPALLLALCLLVYLKPYYGIRHDSVLYLGQALLRARPEEFGRDLFFAYGSQAQFTVFPFVLVPLLERFPLAELFIALTIAGRICFYAASFLLARELFPGRQAYWALLALLVMPTLYGGHEVFSYAEAFATGRSFAEPLVVLALVAALRGRWPACGAAWLAAAALHPLQALPAALLLWVFAVRADRRWLHALWPVALVPVLAAVTGNERVLQLLARFDDQWLKWVVDGPIQVFVLRWRLQDACRLVTDAFLVWLAWRTCGGTLARVAGPVLAATAIGVGASVLLADLMHLVLPTGMQLWRVHWLLHWLAMASLPVLLARLHERGAQERPRFVILVAIGVFGTPFGPYSAPWAVLILIPLFLAWSRVRDGMRPAFATSLVAVVVAGLAISYLSYALNVLDKFAQHDSNREVIRPDFLLVTHPLVMAGIVLLAVRAWRVGPRLLRGGLVAAGLAFLALATGSWDRRNTLVRHVEAAYRKPSPFGVLPDPGARVFWAQDLRIEPLLAIWTVLGRPAYFSEMQTAGASFNRGTAAVAQHRQEVLEVFKLQAAICSVMNELEGSRKDCVPDADMIRDACEVARGELDYLVIPQRLDHGVLGSWPIPAERKGDRPLTYYLYRCRDFAPAPRAGYGAQAPERSP